MASVLVVSPVGVVPSLSGNQARVLEMVEAMESLGHVVSFVHLLDRRSFTHVWDAGGMQKRFPGRYYPVELGWMKREVPGVEWVRISAAYWLRTRVANALKSKVLGLGRGSHRLWARYAGILWRVLPKGSMVSGELKNWFRGVVLSVRPDAVVVNYAVFAPLFEECGDARRVLETHDAFAGRNMRLAASGAGIEQYWFDLSPSGERALQAMADEVIAIQESEAEGFRQSHRGPGHPAIHCLDVLAAAKPCPWPAGQGPFCFGYFGADTATNRSDLAWFLAEVWPGVISMAPQARLQVAGSICGAFQGEHAAERGVNWVGRVEHPADFYSTCHVMVNPCRSGSGLKIKTLEALRHGRGVLALPEGAQGLPGGEAAGLLVSEDACSLREACASMLQDAGKARKLGLAAGRLISSRSRENMERLARVVPGKSVGSKSV